jgi:hypothetical protein
MRVFVICLAFIAMSAIPCPAEDFVSGTPRAEAASLSDAAQGALQGGTEALVSGIGLAASAASLSSGLAPRSVNVIAVIGAGAEAAARSTDQEGAHGHGGGHGQ